MKGDPGGEFTMVKLVGRIDRIVPPLWDPAKREGVILLISG